MKYYMIKKLFLVAIVLFSMIGQVKAAEKVVVAYVTSWSSIMPDPFVMTHINYAFGGVGSDNKVYSDGTSRLKNIVKLKEKNPELKILLSVGGWGRGKFTPMAANEKARQIFAESCVKFCRDYNLDGIDIDWEFPGNNSSGEKSPNDEKQNYTLLMRDLREALGDKFLLTMASSADPGYYDYKSCIQYLDFVNVMTYDMSGPPNHHSALCRGGVVGNGWLVMHESIQRHLTAGIPAHKLVMGLAFYGNSGAGSQISLQEIKNGIASGKWIDHWDDVAKVPYVTDASGKFAYGYDDERSLTIKCQYILDNDLAGGMYWEYNNDDNIGTERTTVFEKLMGGIVEKKEVKIGDYPLDYIGLNTYSAILDMEQDCVYTMSGAEELTDGSWYYDPDFLRPVDGGYGFVPITGRYKITAFFNTHYFQILPVDATGNLLTYSKEDGTGAIWMIGNANVGKPDIAHAGNWGASNGWNPTPDMFVAVPQVADKIYQLTLTVGQQLVATDVNFKFFHQPGWGNNNSDEFNVRDGSHYHISTTSNVFRIDNEENGNIKLVEGAKLTDGATYVFTIDCSDPTSAVLIVSDGTTGVSAPWNFCSRNQSSGIFDLQGRRVVTPSRGIHIQNGRKFMIK